ncbi:3-phosphoserine/phosphohydroxythreonine transaminase [Roseimaritima ulvae]|uniref:Phosphoserine aminotransferase n=1 Tax=Roseimaritima ulvae TaxID=980254 RepID=A0A5B9QYC2_9BACT|nr:3-phosphoserine/phosphohydroxythreonine transaminase [Roseimaritima ulvae]QEG42899.1 Phosphoserine aminotransferase [Roseimaritima ulvae]
MATSSVEQRVYNFSAGPAVLPVSVLERVRDEMLCLPGAGCSLLEMSHRDKRFLEILHGAEAGLRDLLSISDDYTVLFLQGGSRLQFSMIPANLLRGSSTAAEYMLTGSWSKKAIEEARKEGPVNVCWDGKSDNYASLPAAGQCNVPDDAAYLYYCSNETIQGVQFPSEPECPQDVPLVCDASSDFLCRPLDVAKYGILYACAQKNAGPAGVTAVIIRKDLLPRGSEDLPGYLQYRNHAEADSEWNTPPTFAVYVMGLVTEWLASQGGLAAMETLNRRKSQMLYDVVDQFPQFYQGHAQADCRSLMNVTFKLPNDDLQAEFLSQAAANQLCNLKGHRSVGGIRASIYNAMPEAGVAALADLMRDFANQHA